MNNIEILADTLNIVDKGGYEYDGRFIPLKLDKERLISRRAAPEPSGNTPDRNSTQR